MPIKISLHIERGGWIELLVLLLKMTLYLLKWFGRRIVRFFDISKKMVQVTVDGKEYNLDEKQAGAMKYIEEAEALEKGKSVLIYLI